MIENNIIYGANSLIEILFIIVPWALGYCMKQGYNLTQTFF